MNNLAHVLGDYDLYFNLIFYVLELWLIQPKAHIRLPITHSHGIARVL